ncbi:MAG TPA: type VI secretion system-associated FHA domain protein TagH [Candidatus Binatia bacterium]|nr:type VI secretion system-associated FHA domain protein TagH [Candidatus Binatia bacterium]
MNLTLTIVHAPDSFTGEDLEVAPEEIAVIGRDASCDWVLADPKCELSRRHCRVLFRDGDWWIEDLQSTNGVLLPDGYRKVGRDRPFRLQDQQMLVLGGYTVRVEFEPGRRPSRLPTEEFRPRQFDAQESYDPPPMSLRPLSADPEPVEHDPMRLPEVHFDPTPIIPQEAGAVPREQDKVTEQGGLIPTDWMPGQSLLKRTPRPEHSRISRSTPKIPPGGFEHTGAQAVGPAAPAPSAAPAGAVAQGSLQATAFDDAVRTLLVAAGIDTGAMDSLMAEEIGQSFRIAMIGLMELLRARSEVKRQFKMDDSVMQARGNNPLKVEVTIGEVFADFFTRRNPRNLPAPEAVASAIDDLKWHQLAVMAGTRSALFEVLRSFDPQVLEQTFNDEAKGRGRSWSGGGPKYWDQYVEMYERIRTDTESFFNREFGDVFVEEYEHQVRELERKFGSSSTEGRRRFNSKSRGTG